MAAPQANLRERTTKLLRERTTKLTTAHSVRDVEERKQLKLATLQSEVGALKQRADDAEATWAAAQL